LERHLGKKVEQDMVINWMEVVREYRNMTHAEICSLKNCYLKTGFASWWVLSQKTQPRKDQEKEGFIITCSK